jgi:hypothetical protein
MTTLFERNIRHNQLVALYAYWNVCRQDRPVPQQSALNAVGLAPWRENLAIIRVRERKNFTYGFYGSGFREAFGVDMTGLDISTLPHEQTSILREEYRSVVTTRKPLWRSYGAWFGEDYQTWERVSLPLASQDDAIAYILVGAYRLT